MAASVNYNIPVVGTTPPTAAQAALLSMVSASVVLGDTDTTAVITHNFGLTAAQLGSGFPLVFRTNQAVGTSPVFPAFAAASNTLTLTKVSLVGSNGTAFVTLLRPNSLMM